MSARGIQNQVRPFVIPQYTLADYQAFFFAGATCCTLSHGAMTPIDVVKTRIQADLAFKGVGFFSGTRQVVTKESVSALLTGFGPTAVGYFVQGGAKFAGYGFWRKKFSEIAGDQETMVKHRTAIYLGAASITEFFADILLTPLEATRIWPNG